MTSQLAQLIDDTINDASNSGHFEKEETTDLRLVAHLIAEENEADEDDLTLIRSTEDDLDLPIFVEYESAPPESGSGSPDLVALARNAPALPPPLRGKTFAPHADPLLAAVLSALDPSHSSGH